MGPAPDALDARTRAHMVSELDTDLRAARFYLSPWLTEEGRAQWPDLLRAALRARDAGWLADALDYNDLLQAACSRDVDALAERVPPTAARTLAEGQFHGYYVRAVCRRAVADGLRTVTIFRAGASAVGAREADTLVDSELEAHALLEDIRNDPAVAPAARFLGGPGSGLSVRLARSPSGSEA